MPYRIACPRCQRRGFVRAERIIVKGEALTRYFCGACLHNWETREPPPPPLPPETGHDDDEG